MTQSTCSNSPDAATRSASCHSEDAAALWVTIGDKCPLVIIDFEHVDVVDTYDNSNNNKRSLAADDDCHMAASYDMMRLTLQLCLVEFQHVDCVMHCSCTLHIL